MRDEGKLQRSAGAQLVKTIGRRKHGGDLVALAGEMRRACQALNNFRVQGISLTLQGCEPDFFEKSPYREARTVAHSISLPWKP
jgi:hypothetical protein